MPSTSRRLVGVIACSLALLAGLTTAATPAAAQIGSGEITGIVTDATGAALPGVTVTSTHTATGRTRATVTTTTGTFTVPGLRPGSYRIDVELSGFAPVRYENVRVMTGEVVRLATQLKPGAISEQVTVTGATPALRTATASLGASVEQERVTGLPLNGRSFITLAALAPGVALPPNSQLPRINGGRPRTNEYLFDGIAVLQPEPGQVPFFPNVDAIQEFRIESNSPPAQFGRFNGGVVNLTTRSGSNVIHGTGFEFFRHEALNARNLFASQDESKPRFRRNQFGGVLGGPIVRDRTFFFVDYQGQRHQIGRTVISTVPTLLQRQGVFTEPIAGRVPVVYDPSTTVINSGTASRSPFAGNAIPLNQVDPVARALLERYPLPTGPGTANNFRRTDVEQNDHDLLGGRIDQRLSNADQVFAKLTNFREDFIPVTPLPDGSGNITTGTLGPQQTTSWAFASNYQHTFSGSLLNELRGGDTRRRVTREAAPLAADIHIPGLPSSAAFTETMPTFLVSGYQQLGSPANTASRFSTGVTEIADTLTWVTGRHTVKAGLDWRWERLDVIQPPSPTGSFSFNAIGSDLPGVSNTGTPLASFLLGQVQLFSIDLQQSTIQERAHVQEYFIQDEWKVSPKLTLSPGLRYTLNFPSTEKNGQTAIFDLETQRLTYPGDEPVRELKKDNFGPRFGLVYALTDRTVVSSGYALVWIEMAGITTPFTTPTFPFIQTVSDRALDTISPAFVLANGPTVAPIAPTADAGLGHGVFSVDRALGSGYVQQWNVAFQRQLGRATAFEAAYVGSKITNVGVPDVNLNQLTAEQLAMGSSLLQRVPNPYFGIVPRSSSLGDPTITVAQLLKPYPAYTTVSLYRNNVGTTRYDGLELSLRQRFDGGLGYSVAYTRSKLVDDASSVFDASILTGPVANFPVADSFNRGLERDYSTGDIPHVFVASAVWDVPFGQERSRQLSGVSGALLSNWTVSGIVTLQSGVPVAVTQATNFNAFAGFGTQRPNIVGDPELPSDERSTARWFNTSAFAVASQFTIGTASRNPVRGPSYRNVDVTLSRRLRVAAGTAIEVRAEAFNLLNTPPLGNPNGVAGSAAFGTITSAGDPRVIQLAVKLLF